jgi:pimeloyl-ACP methyl ester carboxylesterase
VIRYDRLGIGLSDPGPAGGHADAGAEAGRLAELLDGLGLGRVALLGLSWGGCVALALAARHPDRVGRVATVGALLSGADVAPAALRAAIAAAVRAHWGTGSRLLADIWIPGTDAATRERFALLQRVSATAEVAASALESVYETDVRPWLGDVAVPASSPTAATTAPCRSPRAATWPRASRARGSCRWTATSTWRGSGTPARCSTPSCRSCGRCRRADEAGTAPSDRAASARSWAHRRRARDAEIAVRLQLSPHTVHRHVANIRTKLGQPSRAAAVAHAGRLGII